MTDWLRYIAMIFYAPVRGMRAVRDRGGLAPAILCSLVLNGGFLGYLVWTYVRGTFGLRGFASGLAGLLQATGSSMFVAIIFVPLALAFANLLDRRASYRLLLQQEYASVAATCLYAVAIASLITFVMVIAVRILGADLLLGQKLLWWFQEQLRQQPEAAAAFRFNPTLLNPGILFAAIAFGLFVLIFGVWAVIALIVSLRLSIAHSLLVVLVAGMILLPVSYRVLPLFCTILPSPLLPVARLLQRHRQQSTGASRLQTESRGRDDQSARFFGALQSGIDSSAAW